MAAWYDGFWENQTQCGGCGARVWGGGDTCEECLTNPPPVIVDDLNAPCPWCPADAGHSYREAPDCPYFKLSEEELFAIFEEDARMRNKVDLR